MSDNRLSTEKIQDGKYRSPRCDDNGYQEIVLVSGAGGTGTTVTIDQTTPGTTESVTVKASGGIGSLTETVPASDTASSGLNGRLQRIAQRLSSLITLVPTALSALGNFKIVLSESVVGHKSSVTLTRPATTPTYLAGQAIGDTNGSAILTFSNLGPANAVVLLTDLFLELRVSSSTIGRMTAYFYNTQPAAIADTGTWDYASGDHGKMVTFFQISQPTDIGSAYLSKNYVGQSVQLGSSGQLYCIITTDISYTATSSAVKKIDLYSLEQ